MSLKKILTFGALAFAVFFLVQSPAEAAKLVKVTGEHAGDWFGQAAESLSKFLRTLV